MLVQLHHQFKDDKTEMCTQREINNYTEMHAFVDDTKISHPLPENAIYLAVTEKSKHFVMQELKPKQEKENHEKT